MTIDHAYATRIVRNGITRARDEEKAARQEAAEFLTGDYALDSFRVKNLLAAQAYARPWHFLAELLKGDGEDEVSALHKARKRFTRDLVEHGEKQSTCALSNEMDRLEREGARRFLQRTEVALD